LGDQTVQLKLQPQGEATVDFEYRFDTPGSHLISVVLDNDALPNDNRADAVVTVTDSVPVLLVDGDQQADPTKCETYFANAALKSGGDRPWIKATTISPAELSAERLKSMSLAVIANVETLSEPAIKALRKFVASGHGVLFTLGDRVDKQRYHAMLLKGVDEFFPCRLDTIGEEDGQVKRGVRVASQSLDLPWLRPFRSDQGGALSDARWSRWWKVVVLNDGPEKRPLSSGPQNLGGETIAEGVDDSPFAEPTIGTAVVEVRLTTGDPLIVSRHYGRGVIAVLTSSLDADWNTLPAKQDYVPFLHELLFSLSSQTASRNVDVGQPLLLAIAADLNVEDFHFLNPSNKSQPVERVDDAYQPLARLRSTTLPGVYRFAKKRAKPDEATRPEYFAVNFDRSESNLTTLIEAQRAVLSGEDRMKFVAGLPDLRDNMFTESARAEIWWLLLYAFLGSLIIETWMTRRMVRGAYTE
jgi:hypothetical protein